MYSLPSDARLDRHLAIEARIEPLPDLLATMSRACGATLTVERKMMGLKATVLVAARPVRRTMGDLASVFDADWTPVEGGYRLEMSVPKRNLLERYLDAERKAQREATERKWRSAAAIAKNDWASIPGLLQASMTALSGFTTNQDPGFAEAHARYEALDAVSRNGSNFLLGRMLMGFSDRDWTALWEGRAYYASSIAKGGIPKLPDDSVAIVAPMNHREPGTPLTPVRAFFRYDLDLGSAGYAVNYDGGSMLARPGTGWGGEDESLYKHPFRRAQDAWATPRAESKAPELDRPLKRVDRTPSPWEGPWANDSDTLEVLHRQSGLDIVAEASRRASHRAPGPFAEATVREALENWSFAGDTRVEGGALLYRPFAFWNRRPTEPPEAAMRRWEARPDRGIDAMAELVAALTPVQARLLASMSSRKRLDRLDSGIPGLRVWAALSTEQRRRLLAGEGVPLAGLNAPAREAALAAMLEGVFGGGSLSGRMLTLFDGPWDPTSLGDLAIWATTKGVETGSMWTDAPSGTADESLFKLGPVPGIALELGPARGDGITFTLPQK